MTLYGSYKIEAHLRQQWLAHRKIGMQQILMESQYEGVCRILNIVCDCILRIDSDGKILEPSARFAAILMQAGNHNLEGTCIYDYMADEAQIKVFKEMVIGSGSQSAGMVHLTLKDVYGTVFSSDVYHTRTVHNKDIEYLVGIVENRPREPYPMHNPSANDDSLSSGGTALVLGRLAEEVEEGGSSSVGSTGSGTFDVEEVAVEFLADAEAGFPILSWSPGFASLIGQISEMQKLSRLLIHGEKKWNGCVQDMVNAFNNFCQNVIVDDLTIRKPRSDIVYRIDATSLDFVGVRLSPEGDDDFDIVIRMVLDGIHRRRSRRLHTSRSGRLTAVMRRSLESL